MENIAVALGSEFKIYLPQLIPQILRVLLHDTSRGRSVTGKLLLALQKFGSTLNDYMHLILPPIVRLFDPSTPGLTTKPISAVVWRKVLLVFFMIFELGPCLEPL